MRTECLSSSTLFLLPCCNTMPLLYPLASLHDVEDSEDDDDDDDDASFYASPFDAVFVAHSCGTPTQIDHIHQDVLFCSRERLQCLRNL